MLNVIIGIFVIGLIVVTILIGSILYTAKSILFRRYLNRYFVVTRNGKGVYTLHHTPVLGFYYTKREKYFRLQKEAIGIFQTRFPDAELQSETSTLQGYYAKLGLSGTPVPQNRVGRVTGIGMNDFLILLNLANYRKRNEREWQFIHLMRRVRKSPPLQYVLLSGKNSA